MTGERAGYGERGQQWWFTEWMFRWFYLALLAIATWLAYKQIPVAMELLKVIP